MNLNLIKALSLFLGATWGVCNLFLLKHFLKNLLLKGKKNYVKLALLFTLKCPLLYLSGYWLLQAPSLPNAYLLMGFSLILLALLFKGLYRSSKRV